ncbi:Predicted small secreted protein [Rubritalea squalenifaciens DSM 18772]|uniref:Predicted small secreted protein n=2 Tax=Rubritalea TaxID=361050 RepID=A0A1M6P3H7_9BACT|nr:entericidin A/B family lipoprotein [Rubritalea squalenifaciens]SHK02529.1 Predicted small secreted protein [Rubritalea squalenifaciens DSM 18772]
MKNCTKMILAVVGLAALALSSCNTFRGMGQDIRAGGDAISDAASR